MKNQGSIGDEIKPDMGTALAIAANSTRIIGK